MNTSDLLLPVLRSSCLGGVGVLLMLCIRAVLGKSLAPSWRCWLWLPVAALFVMPRLPDLGWHWRASALPDMVQNAIEPDSHPAAVTAHFASESLGASLTPAPSATSTFSLLDWAAITWVSGTGGLVALWLLSYAWLMRRVHRGRKPAPESLRNLLGSCAREAGLRKTPRLMVSDAVESPAVAGLFRPCVLVPQSLPTLLDERELRLVLLHEMGHLKRHDLWFHWLSALLLAVHWFNPLPWLASWLFRADREAACDASVLAARREDARGVYGDTLLKLQAHFGRALPLRPMIGVLGGTDMLRQRILDIAHHGRGSRWAGRLAFLMTMGAAGGIAVLAGKPPAVVKGASSVVVEPSVANAEEIAKRAREETLHRIDVLAGVVERQVYISSKIVSLEKLDGLALPADKPDEISKAAASPDLLQFFSQAAGAKGAEPSGIFSIAGVLTDPQFQVVIRALNQKKGVELLSAPSVTTRSGQKAVVETLQKMRYPTEFKPGENGQPAQVVDTAERLIGWGLGLEPVIGNDGQTVDLNITVENNAFEKWETYGPGIKQPVFHHSKATTSVTIWDGQTVCLGSEAFVHDAESFSKMDPANPPAAHRRHVLIFVTPKIIDPAGRPGPWKVEDNQGIVIPEVRLSDVSLLDAVNQIYDLAKKHDRRGKGINLMLRHPVSDELRVTLNSTDAKVSSLLGLLATLAHLDLQVEDNTVLLLPRGEQGSTPKKTGVLNHVHATIGQKSFIKGDAIEILNVSATSPNFEVGDRVIVKGRCQLASHEAASLCLFTTHIAGSGSEEVDPSQRTRVAKGTNDFEVACTIKEKGYLHVSFYDVASGEGFGGVYFGTLQQMEALNVGDFPSVEDRRTERPNFKDRGGVQFVKPLKAPETKPQK